MEVEEKGKGGERMGEKKAEVGWEGKWRSRRMGREIIKKNYDVRQEDANSKRSVGGTAGGGGGG